MSFKQLFIQNKAYLSYQNNSLIVQNDGRETPVSFDDIDIVVIENQQTTLTSYLLSKLALADIVVIFVDETFMPSAISIGLYKNSRTTLVQTAQMSLSQPKKNRLWQEIVKTKIHHQALVLGEYDDREYLFTLVNKVQSADKTYIESTAAVYYFKTLFDIGFIRQDEQDARNGALNYGYSILRSSIARYIIAYGLNPAFGIWHSSGLNAFNLADDFLEPCRPVIDRYVKANIEDNTSLTPQIKQELVSLLFTQVVDSIGRQVLLKDALRSLVASYQSVCLGKREDLELFTIK